MQENTPSPAVSVETEDGTKIELSQGVVDGLLQAFQIFLDWASSNPLLFISFLIFLIVLLRVLQKGRIEKRMSYKEYRDTRRDKQGQLGVLPLPKPGDSSSQNNPNGSDN